MASARQTAFEVLQRWEESSTYAEELIAQQSLNHQLSTADRGFTNALVLGVLRNLSLLDHWINSMRGRGKLNNDARNALRLGLYQIVFMRVPDHAAVNESVQLVRKHARPVVNAILRRSTRERESLLAGIDSLPPELRFSMPDFLIEKWRSQFGAEATSALCEWSSRPAEIIVRANRLLAGALETIESSPDAAPSPARPDSSASNRSRWPGSMMGSPMCRIQRRQSPLRCSLPPRASASSTPARPPVARPPSWLK